MFSRLAKSFPVLIVILCFGLPVAGQSGSRIDSVFRAADDPRRLPESVILLLESELPKFSSPTEQAGIHMRISSAYLKINGLDSAAIHAWTAARLVPTNDLVCGTAYANLGYVAYEKQALDRARNSYEKALTSFQRTNNKSGQFASWCKLASIAERQSAFQEALDSYQRAMAVAMEQQDSVGLRNVTFFMAPIFRQLGRYDDALEYLNTSLKVSAPDRERRAAVYMELGKLFEDQSYLRKALDAYRQAQSLVGDEGYKFPSYHSQLRLYVAMNKADTAVLYADSTEMEAMRGGSDDDLQACFLSRFQLAERMGDTARALRYHKQYREYHDAVMQGEFERRVENVRDELLLGANEAAIRTAEWEARWNAANALRERQWLYFKFLTGGVLMLLTLIAFLWYRSYQRHKRLIHEHEGRIRELHILKEKLFTVIARDLQAPLATYNNLTRSMSGQLNTGSKQDVTAYLSELNMASHELTQLLNQLLEWAFTQSGTMPFRPELLRCHQMATEVEEQMRPLAKEKNVAVSFLIPEGLHAYADRTMITITLRTLLYNAIRFTPGGKAVTIFSGKKDQLITLGVKDNGVGISADKISRLFTWSNDPVGHAGARGRGVGLPMCRELVRRNGGDLYVESQVSEGATFYFTLPEYGPVVEDITR